MTCPTARSLHARRSPVRAATPHPWPRARRSRPALARAVFLAVAVAAVAVAVAAAAVPAATAEETAPTARAGLVVQFGDGTTRAFCLELDRPGLTGLDLLQRTGLDTRIEVSAMGAAVCRIQGDGCADHEDCYCRCQTVGGPCAYWSYQWLDDGAWAYADAGPSARLVADGDVDGWAWGEGTADAGPAPPVMTFQDVCGDGEATTASTAPAPAPGRPSPAAVGAVVAVLALATGAWLWAGRR